MKNKTLFLSLVLALGFVSRAFSAEELKYMAYNFYSDPHMHETSGRFDSFLIDFMAEKTPNATYWAMANFSLDVKSEKTQKAYEGIRGVNGYCGVQNSDRKVGSTTPPTPSTAPSSSTYNERLSRATTAVSAKSCSVAAN